MCYTYQKGGLAQATEKLGITTSSFTKKAVQLAKSNRVRLVDGRELEYWLLVT